MNWESFDSGKLYEDGIYLAQFIYPDEPNQIHLELLQSIHVEGKQYWGRLKFRWQFDWLAETTQILKLFRIED